MTRILIVDDEESVRRTFRAMLEREGFEISEAPDGDTGLAVFLAVKPALVIIDVIMPRQTGIETIQKLRALDASVPIIAISGGGRAVDLRFLAVAGAHGASRQLVKPVRRSDLLDAIAGCLN